MKLNIKYYLLFALIAILVSCNGKVSKDNSLGYIPALEAIDTKISSWVDSGYYDGAVARIIRNNEILFEADYGGYTDTTILHVASAGKWIVSATIASIVDEGQLSWNDKVKDYLPEFDDEKGEATLLQLLSHTSGYPDYQPSENRRDDYQTLEESVANIVGLPADTLAGTLFRYGGLGMQVAGRMAEIATGKHWEDIFQERIATPLRMKKSAFTPVSDEGGFSPMLGGGFRTTLHDYMNFLSMILAKGMFEGHSVLSEHSINQIEADQVKEAKVWQPEYVMKSKQNQHNGIYGLGVWREEIDESNRATLISSPGWAGAYPWVDRVNNTYGFVLAKANVERMNSAGFSSFYESAGASLLVRDIINRMDYPCNLTKGYVEIEGASLYYEEMGDGEALILLHGHSLDHRMWDEQFLEFSKKYRTIRYDLRGYGYSSPQNEQDQFTHVEDLVQLMDSLEINKAHIVGLSLGGYIGTDLLGWFPDRISSAVLASGNIRPTPKPSVPMSAEEAWRREEEIAALKRKGIDVMKREWFNGLMNSGGSQKENMRKPLWTMIYQWDAWQPLHKEVRVIAGGDAYDKLKKNKPTIPVMILEGQSANNHYLKNPEILNHLPNGVLVVLYDCGHMLNMERPREFNDVVLKFIENKKR